MSSRFPWRAAISFHHGWDWQMACSLRLVGRVPAGLESLGALDLLSGVLQIEILVWQRCQAVPSERDIP